MKPFEDIFPLPGETDAKNFVERVNRFLDLNPAGLITKPFKMHYNKALSDFSKLTPKSGGIVPAWYGKNEHGVEQVVGLCKKRRIL